MKSVMAGCALLLVAAWPAQADWRLDQFMISVWGGPTDAATARAYADAGFNTVMSRYESLDFCRAAGLRAIVLGGTPESAANHRGDPAVWGWYVQDEPKAEEFEQAGQKAAAFAAADPTHPPYVNLMAWMDLDQYFKAVPMPFLSYDYYQWWWNPRHYCGRLEAHRAAALARGIPLICWIEANADQRYEWGKPGATYLPDNAAKLRQSVMAALAYGVKGIQWFNDSLVFERSRELRTRLTASGRDIQAINRDLRGLGPTLLGLRSRAVYHAEPLPPSTQPLPAGGPVQVRGGHMTLGLLDNSAGRTLYLLVNRDIARARPATISWDGTGRLVRRLDPATGQWLPVATWDSRGRTAARVTLAPGDGVLLAPDGALGDGGH